MRNATLCSLLDLVCHVRLSYSAEDLILQQLSLVALPHVATSYHQASLDHQGLHAGQ